MFSGFQHVGLSYLFSGLLLSIFSDAIINWFFLSFNIWMFFGMYRNTINIFYIDLISYNTAKLLIPVAF